MSTDKILGKTHHEDHQQELEPTNSLNTQDRITDKNEHSSVDSSEPEGKKNECFERGAQKNTSELILQNIPENDHKLSLLISTLTTRTKLGIFKDDKLEYYYQEPRCDLTPSQGDIYYAKVAKVSSGIEAAFVDIDHKRSAFLHQSDMKLSEEDRTKPLTKLLHVGQRILVQVLKAPMGTKGARVTTKISLATSYLVYLPRTQSNKLSSKITCPQIREETLEKLDSLSVKGLIARTAACSLPLESLEHDAVFLERSWRKIEQKALSFTQPGLIQKEINPPLKIIRDFVKLGLEEIHVDCSKLQKEIEQFYQDFLPDKSIIVKTHRDIMSFKSFYDQKKKLNSPVVLLKSGGNIVIEQTESMTTIDVNTASFLGRDNHHETILKTNLEAAKALMWELRRRQVGGIIIVDFIDMPTEEDKQLVEQALLEASYDDVMPISIFPFTELGLIQMSRKRSDETLTHQQTQMCEVCQGQGRYFNIEFVFENIIEELVSMKSLYSGKTIQILATQALSNYIKNQKDALAQLKERFEITLTTSVEEFFLDLHYEIISLN